MLISRTLYATDLEGKQVFDAEVKILAKKNQTKCVSNYFHRVALNFMLRLRMSSAFQFQTSSHASLNEFLIAVKDE